LINNKYIAFINILTKLRAFKIKKPDPENSEPG